MAEKQNPSPSGPSEYENRPAPGESPEEFLLRWVAPVPKPTPPLSSYADQLERWILADSEEERRAMEEEEKKEQAPKEEPSFLPDPWEPTVLLPSAVACPDLKLGKGGPPLALLIDLEEEEEEDGQVKIEEVEVPKDALEVLSSNAHPPPIVEEVGSLSLASSQEEKESREAVKELEEILIVQEQEGKRKVPSLASPTVKRPAIMVVSPLPSVGKGKPLPSQPTQQPHSAPAPPPPRPMGRGRVLRLPREYNLRRQLTVEDCESGTDLPFSPPEEPPVSEEYQQKWIEEERKRRAAQSRADREAALEKKRRDEAEKRRIEEEKRKIEEEKRKLREDRKRIEEMKEKERRKREEEKKRNKQRGEWKFEKWHNAYLEAERRKEEDLKSKWEETTARLWREAREKEKRMEEVRREIEEEKRKERREREKVGRDEEVEAPRRRVPVLSPSPITPSARLEQALRPR